MDKQEINKFVLKLANDNIKHNLNEELYNQFKKIFCDWFETVVMQNILDYVIYRDEWCSNCYSIQFKHELFKDENEEYIKAIIVEIFQHTLMECSYTYFFDNKKENYPTFVFSW